MKKFEIPGSFFDFIDGSFIINGEVTLSKKTPAKHFINNIINIFHIQPTTTGSGVYVFEINGWVGDHIIELIIAKEKLLKIDCILIHYFENNTVDNGVSESSLVKKIQIKSGIPGHMKGLSEIAFQFSWGIVIVQHDIKASSSCMILQYKTA
ncbi:hypothetical protein [Janthinobacterium sp. 13]|uniref:hypothetical protein n=1 Tax=Janthinobacterium sp. 13 TaxID=2035211 RepID=UPI00117A7B29|nr:hypothetical protein [Janthinobacterium sp. 13]